MEKEHHPEDSIIYINQGYLIIKDNKRLYYVDYYILGQVMECLNPPEDISNYVCQDREVKIYRPKYDIVTRKFLGLYEALGYFSVRSDPNEHFSDYGFVKRTQKYYILIIKEGFQVLSARHFLIGANYSLKVAVYRPHFQRFIISYLLLLIEVKKLIDT